MRIEAYNQIAQLYNATSVNRTSSTSSVASAKDKITISRAGQDYQIAKQAVSQASDVREDKVADIRSQIQAGTYSVDTDDFASKLLQKFNEFK